MTTQSKTPPLPDEGVSEHTQATNCQEYTTPHTGAQLLERRVSIARHGTAFLVASAAANVIALSFLSHAQTITPTLILSPAEAQSLAGALLELADDLDRDARAREWSRSLFETADASAESYAGRPR